VELHLHRASRVSYHEFSTEFYTFVEKAVENKPLNKWLKKHGCGKAFD
jgi:hypothetical protein